VEQRYIKYLTFTFACGGVCAKYDQYKSYSGNAVVTSSVCLLLLFFVVGLTLSRYWDVVQQRRYSSVPLCGLDGPFRYQLFIITGNLPGAGESFDDANAPNHF